MSDHLHPVPDEQLAARITAYALGEVSAFEAAEIEAIIEKSPELKLVLTRTRILHDLVKEAETTSNQPATEWKLPTEKHAKLEPVLGPVPVLMPQREKRIRRLAFRAGIGFAAVFAITVFLTHFIQFPSIVREESPTIVTYMAAPSSQQDNQNANNELRKAIRDQEDRVEENRKILTAITRTKGLAYYGRDDLGAGNDKTERSIDPGTFAEVKQELETEQALLGQMKRELVESEINDKNPIRARTIAASPASPRPIPVPEGELALADPTTDFSDADDFGAGWGEGGEKVHIGGQVGTPGAVDFKENLTLKEAVVRAGGATPFGSQKRVRVFRDGKTLTYDLTNPEFDDIILQPGDSVEMPQKNWMSCGASRDELLAATPEVNSIVTGGLRSGDSAINRNTIDAILNNPDRTTRSEPRSQTAETSTDPFADISGASVGRALNAKPPTEDFFAEKKTDDEPITRSNPALNQEHSKNVDKVRRNLYKAQGNFDLGKFDDAKKDYEDILRIDPYNSAARRGMEKIAAAKSDYYRAAYDQTRAELLMQVDEDWELSVPAEPEKNADLRPQPSLVDLSEETPAVQEPFSTFSLNISDASFQVARSAMEKGERPDPTAIKPEQFYNAVDYGDPAPSSSEPVSATIDQTAHPVIPGRNLVRIAIRTASTGRSAAQPLRLTLLVDQSGSMVRADRRAAMDTALAQLATLLTENDQISVIGFARTPRLLADSMPGSAVASLPDLINQTANEGGTNLEQAINLAAELAKRHQLEGAQNRIVLFTDGAVNLGDADPDRLANKIKTLRQQGLAFDIAGIGTNDVNDRLLSELARHGNGRYYLVGENTAANLAQQLAGAFLPAAENVKVQVKLNPERVGNYKLIGFEKDRLKTEDFRNDSVDAAELAADEAGVAIYQVETLPQGAGEIGEVSVRFRNVASGEMVERNWTLPYNAVTPAFDRANQKTQLATLSLLAAQKLQGGPLAVAINFRDLAPTIAELKQTYKNSQKAQQMLQLIEALK